MQKVGQTVLRPTSWVTVFFSSSTDWLANNFFFFLFHSPTLRPFFLLRIGCQRHQICIMGLAVLFTFETINDLFCEFSPRARCHCHKLMLKCCNVMTATLWWKKGEVGCPEIKGNINQIKTDECSAKWLAHQLQWLLTVVSYVNKQTLLNVREMAIGAYDLL